MKELLQAFRKDLEQFEQATQSFYNGEMTKQEYKGISGGFGSYSERGGKRGMLRLRLPAGRLPKEKLKFILDMANLYQIDTFKITTCETIQLHHLTPEQIVAISTAALDHGIYCRGGGGDHPRNVMASPLSGVQQGESFDVIPYAQAVSDYLLSILYEIKMPRKLKVGFSNHADNITHATIRDLGFVAQEDGTFDVYIAGGMGPNPRMGLKVAHHVSGTQLLFYTRAMVDTFLEHGNYTLRAKARTRYMQEALGEDGLRKAFDDKLQALQQKGGLKLQVQEQPVTKTGQGMTTGKRIIPQKQQGLFAVSYHPLGGMPTLSTLSAIYQSIENWEGVEVRLSADGTMYVINCTADEANKICEITQDGAQTLFEHSVACIGAATCQQGVRDSQALYHACVQAVRQAKIPDGALPQIHISGCPSSCGTHQIGAMGFHGGVKMIKKTPLAAYTLHVGGCAQLGKEQFAENWGAILQEKIPDFLVEVGKTVAQSGQSFVNWLPENKETLRKIAQPYLD